VFWALAVAVLGAAFIWVGLGSLRQMWDNFPVRTRTGQVWKALAIAIVESGSSTYGPKLVLVGAVLLVVGLLSFLADFIDLFH
jgi:hypothetical protein